MKFEPLIGMARQAKLRRMKMECDPQWVLDLAAERDQLRAEIEALRKDAERYGLLANMIVADCTGAEMTPQQAALFGSLNDITQIRTTAEFDAVFDAALAGKGGAQ